MAARRGTRQDTEPQLTEEELTMPNNAPNEVCHGLDLDEFETRMGASQARARALVGCEPPASGADVPIRFRFR